MHISLKGDLSPFTAGFLPSAFAPPEASVDDKAVRNRRGKSLSQERRQGKNSDPLWMQRWWFSSIPLTRAVPCAKPKWGTGKEILSLSCLTSGDLNIQMTFYEINRGQGLALESWLWHPRQDHGEREQIQSKCAVLGFPGSAAASASSSGWAFSILNEWWQERGLWHSLCVGTHLSRTFSPLLPVPFIGQKLFEKGLK